MDLTTTSHAPPALDACGVAFKEWAGVCCALDSGRQTILLRKGGVAEASGAFRPEYPRFWLYPTYVHEVAQGLTVESPPPPSDPAVVPIATLAEVAGLAWLDDEAALTRLADRHVWTSETLAARYHYRRPGLWLMLVRIHRLPEPHTPSGTPGYAGCRTWVHLEAPLSTCGLRTVLDDAAFSAEAAEIERRIGRPLDRPESAS